MERGGMENRIMDLYRLIDKSHYQYDFYIESGREGVFDDEIIDLGGRVFYVESPSRFNIPHFKRFGEFLSSHPEYQIVYAYNQWAGSYLKQAKIRGVPFRVANARTAIDKKSLKNLIKSFAKKNVNKYATHKFAVSRKAANWLFGEETVKNSQVEIWPNAIDTKSFAFSRSIRDEVRGELGFKDELVIIHVGNLRYEKNHPFLIEVFAAITKIHSDAQLVLVGRGDLNIIEQDIVKYGLSDRVHFLGVRSDVNRLLQAGDYFIFPSYYEGFPGAVLEAECSGLKCLISDSITNEVLLTDHIIALPLSLGGNQWAKRIEMISPVDREKAWETVRDAGYDIHDLVIRTEAFYQNTLKID